MTATKLRWTKFECDQCGRSEIFTYKPRRNVDAARDRGWDIGKGNIADLCPVCVEMDAAEAAS